MPCPPPSSGTRPCIVAQVREFDSDRDKCQACTADSPSDFDSDSLLPVVNDGLKHLRKIVDVSRNVV